VVEEAANGQEQGGAESRCWGEVRRQSVEESDIGELRVREGVRVVGVREPGRWRVIGLSVGVEGVWLLGRDRRQRAQWVGEGWRYHESLVDAALAWKGRDSWTVGTSLWNISDERQES
jgi:hypothetical protein